MLPGGNCTAEYFACQGTAREPAPSSSMQLDLHAGLLQDPTAPTHLEATAGAPLGENKEKVSFRMGGAPPDSHESESASRILPALDDKRGIPSLRAPIRRQARAWRIPSFKRKSL